MRLRTVTNKIEPIVTNTGAGSDFQKNCLEYHVPFRMIVQALKN